MEPVDLQDYLSPTFAFDGSSIEQCCLPSPPYGPGSGLLLTKKNEHVIVFCRLDGEQKRLRWIERTYAEQLERITGGDGFLCHLTCCNGYVYALAAVACCNYVIRVNIMVHDREVMIILLPFGKLSSSSLDNGRLCMRPTPKGCAELFYVEAVSRYVQANVISDVRLLKLDMTSMKWKEMKDLDDDTVFFVDLAHGCSTFYRPAVASKLGGYIHFLGNMGKVMYSYNVKDNTVSLSSTPCLVPTNHHVSVSLWECRLQIDSKLEEAKEDEIVGSSARADELVKNTRKSHLLNIPFDVFMMIMKHCVGVEYLTLRATCKQCLSGAPKIRWSSATSLRRLRTYSVVSPWLMVFDKHRGVLTFTDPLSGEQYFIKTPREYIRDIQICCTAYGWLLIKVSGYYNFFNPFTKDIRNLPHVPSVRSICFSAPPTSPDCMVVGFTHNLVLDVHVHFVNQEPPYWHKFHMGFGDFDHIAPCITYYPKFYGKDIYTLDEERLNVYREMEEKYCIWEVVAEAPRTRVSGQRFLVTCDQHLLVVIVDAFGEFVEVFKLNHSTREWEKLDSLGRHMIYICGTTSFCVEARTPEMVNKIYFPQLHSKSGKIVFYSLETRKYHTFSGGNVEESFGDLFGTKYHLNRHVWIEPSWF